MIKKLIILHIVLIFTVISGCGGCNKNKHVIDTTEINISPTLKRFEQDLFKCKSITDITELKAAYPSFYPIYVNNIMPHKIRGIESTEEDIAQELYRYISHPDMDSLYKLTQNKFTDFDYYYEQLKEASKYINYYFNEDTIDQITTFISTFEFGSIYNEDTKSFGVGLDMYMGRDFEVYALLNPQNFPSYRVKRFEPYHIAPNCLKSYLNSKIKKNDGNSFLDFAIYEGKKLYAMDLLLPTIEDSLKIGYLDGQIEWNQKQEKNIWSYLVEKELIFSTTKSDFQQHFFNDGPFTTPFGNESSPRAGAWVGWQIVRSYMKKNSDKTLIDLLQNQDNLSIFKASGYRP